MNIKKLLPIVGIIILIYLISTMDISAVLKNFLNIPFLFAFICLFAVVPILISTAIQWQMVLKKQKIHVSFYYSIKNILIGYFYGFITPGGFGAYIKSLYLKEESGQPLPKCISNIITFNTLDFLSLLILGMIGSFFLTSIIPYLFITITIVFITCTALFIFFLRKKKSKDLFTRIIKSNIFSLVKNKLEDPLETFYEHLPSFKDLIIPFIISILGWILLFTEFYFIAILFSIHIPYIWFICIFSIAYVIASLPISIYGLGTREVALISLFSLFSVPAENVLSFSLFCFVIIWVIPSITGAVITSMEHKKFYDNSLKQ
ncbi:MAG: lysylphosphatidylglycerol synthase transmembrane domain-containing protein [Thermoplasmatota archaeon]